MGHKPDVEGTITKMALLLISEHVTLEGLQVALRRCSKESEGYPVRYPQIISRVPGHEVPAIEAEMRAAWDVLTKFVAKWGRWNDDYTNAYIEKGAPTLPQRTVDTVRRTGGWAAYLVLSHTDEKRARDANFQQQRFYEEYKAWVAVERILPDLSKVLQISEGKKLQLLKPMESNKAAAPVPSGEGKAPPRVPVPATREEMAGRAARQQVAIRAWAEQRAGRKFSDEEWAQMKVDAAAKVV